MCTLTYREITATLDCWFKGFKIHLNPDSPGKNSNSQLTRLQLREQRQWHSWGVRGMQHKNEHHGPQFPKSTQCESTHHIKLSQALRNHKILIPEEFPISTSRVNEDDCSCLGTQSLSPVTRDSVSFKLK